MNRLLALIMLFAAALPALAYDSFEELMADMNSRQVEAIKTYLQDNPEAEDVTEARVQLVYGLIAMDDNDGALELLHLMYRDLPEDKSELDLGMAFGQIVVPIIQLYQMDNRKQEGLDFIKDVRRDFSGHGMAPTINDALDEFSGAFNRPGVGEPVNLSFKALDGRQIDTAELKGKVLLLDFWATWCGPCLKAMPDIISVYREFHEKGFEILGISLDSDQGKLKDYLEKENIEWPQFFDGEGWDNRIAGEFGVQSIPTTYLIGPDGLIAAVDPSPAEMRELIPRLLAGSAE